MPKGTKREPKSMPKRIKHQCKHWLRKRRGKSWKFMLFWHGKSSESVELYHAKRGLAISVRGQKNHQKNVKNEVEIHAKTDGKSMLNFDIKKWCQNDWKLCQKGPRKGAKIMKNMKNDMPKITPKFGVEKKWEKPQNQPTLGSPRSDFLSGWGKGGWLNSG